MAARIAVIWLHGLGDRGSSWSNLRGEVNIGAPIEWRFPDAPIAPVTCNGGYRMTSWFDIEEIPVMPDAKDYPDDIKSSVGIIHNMIGDLEKAGFDSKNIIIGGFSQGGALSIQSVLRYPKRLGGAICFSGWLMERNGLSSWTQEANKETPIFWGHGADDMTVHFSNQEIGVKALQEHGLKVVAKSYDDLPHSTCQQEQRDMAKFVADIVNAS
ncbi:hypothetical protein GUITHDRAFT_164389 [Guillardia theta CCMP2712]|uniref:Phospholipase/carboxylesterase/thioesterase domain-containing protein n=2 Tax=Guillardia theta TaxID=55529 RepID=L1IYL7_GUITC|nr:hypothetical protein GUITHDRAFT_164389 [Guillardia theta CCMP2712]EKX41311.1 hypothetical protein GUITHDRAFT_164389 [Guillardia theta CCMP2712]|eukprot:XP_005828291.1 hypothetical protein GUITHDRAFT_164389 [Guillardia theta CCMP2712]